METGAHNWLSTIPIQDQGFYLGKNTFWDSLRIRYDIQLKRLPTQCTCGKPYNIEHGLTCKKGGFISMRHNEVRYFTAELLKEVCHDVQIEHFHY